MLPATSDGVSARWEAGNTKSESSPPALDFDHVPLVGRDRIIGQIVETVASHARGVLLAGDHGTGKTALLEHVGQTFNREVYVVPVRGSSIGARTDYGALRFLIDATEGEEPKNPIFVFQKVSKLLRVRSGGRTVVLLVDNAHLLDELAAVVIGLLVRSGQARTVIASTGISTLSPDLVGLWKDGLLDVQDILPFTPAETETWLATAFNANISPLAVTTLWDHSGGNPLILRTLAAEQVRAGSLMEKDGTYVLAAAVALDGKPLSDVLAARLSRLSVGERNALELLALSGGLSLEMLRRITTPKDIDSLVERGLAVRAGRVMIRVKSPVVAEIVSREVPPGRSMHLQKLLGSSVDLSADSQASMKALASWQLTCGSALEPELALGAAEAANRSGEGGPALRFLTHLRDRRTSHRAVLSEASALLQLNRPAEADEVLEAFSQGPLNLLPLTSMADFILKRAALACIQKDAPSEAEGYLRELRKRLSGTESVPPVASEIMRSLGDQLTLSEATISSYQGRYNESIPALTLLYVNGRGTSEELRLRAGALLSEALAMIGRQDDAVRVAEEVAEKMQVPEIPKRLHAELRKRFIGVFLTAGMWNKCADILSHMTGPRAASGLWLGELDVLGAGLMQAYEGRARQTLEALEPIIVQLRFLRSEPALGVALAASAYAHALQGNLRESSDCLRELKALPQGNAWHFNGHLEYFSALAQAVAAPGPEATAELLQRADEEQLAGRVSHELFFLSALVRLGELTAAPRMLAVARRCQGAFAEACRMLATGLMAENPELLLTAGDLAKGFGNERFCRDAALAAHEIAVRTTNRTAARRALNVAGESERKINGQSPHHAAIALLDCLTGREREIVERVTAGASNRDIAQQLHISVRTVEGHLYQAYTKLQISGRDLLHQVHQEAARASVGE
ncbi:LuxR C-terminal-related transcriptional regulator [Pseudarthrobacter sulfonivorans]|uniref:LuxR C-terminal-related transcriptional regulator n=1 Tax=Pseudarthrobacter sulfonivorans TaxID=121292 RepID=UPI002860FB4E|nr:LuxR C-terminal-related transcriptional regulator [Pseudarthrobacter sulfonivorans]MDR6414887.1 DNA-binding CsgD family transcriptional regulator/DNA replicative helicase MCM subunit Mcm2 (Cdc46/Mcm family) [Pseudarthrobacter sulfonivorans]